MEKRIDKEACEVLQKWAEEMSNGHDETLERPVTRKEFLDEIQWVLCWTREASRSARASLIYSVSVTSILILLLIMDLLGLL